MRTGRLGKSRTSAGMHYVFSTLELKPRMTVPENQAPWLCVTRVQAAPIEIRPKAKKEEEVTGKLCVC
jgi:hypothetical protein